LIPTNPSDRFEDLLAFLTTVGGEEFEQALARSQGASGRELVPLMSLCRFPLPQLYIDYLKRFGHGDGGLYLFGDPNADVNELVRQYRLYERDGYAQLLDNAVVFASGSLSGDLLFLYPDDDSPGEPLVACAEYDEVGVVGEMLAESFTHYVYTCAYCRFRLPRVKGEYIGLLGLDRVLTQAVTATAERQGFASYWFSDVYSSCLERDGLILHSSQASRGTEVYLAGPIGPREEFAAALVAELGLKRLK
jgi:hypothetical protein